MCGLFRSKIEQFLEKQQDFPRGHT
jgi:hypothetical protein